MVTPAIFITALLLTFAAPLLSACTLGMSTFVPMSVHTTENFCYRIVRYFFSFTLLSATLALFCWALGGYTQGTIDLARFSLGPDYAVNMRLFYDGYGIIFLFTATLITNLIAFYSQRYLHRDPSYRRFFIIICLFAFGINLLTLAGTMDLIFAGWEIVGLSSFLLISYFWHRPKAVAAALRAFYIYRFCDLGLLASLLITHFFWHDVSIFGDFANTQPDSILSHVPVAWHWILSLCILLPVLGKSAQVPFCFWLPKAMEGPTHSSAIFYGSLSIHAGVFLLFRTLPIWQSTPGFVYLLAFIGLLTAVCATFFAQVQSNIKGQIGYASIAQVGLMLVELSLDLTTLAYVHMIGNALLRCFQLLISSSILTTHLQFQKSVRSFRRLAHYSWPAILPDHLRANIYAFALNDGYFEYIIKIIIIYPIIYISRITNIIICKYLVNPSISRLRALKLNIPANGGFIMMSFAPMILVLCALVSVGMVTPALGFVSLIIGLLLSLCALGEDLKAYRVLMFSIVSYIFAFAGLTNGRSISLYSLGLFCSSIIAINALRHMICRYELEPLTNYSGLYQQFPLAGNLLLMALLGIVAFPFSATFFGEDFLLNLSVAWGMHYVLILHLIFVLNGVALMRMYAKTMFGRRDNYSADLNLDFTHTQMFTRLAALIIGNIAAFVITLS
jgi:NADH:ubiquinone oxidoreductase subunit 5 (subunit L)/multisubunit Na+/H+ antiporter MnhA subunit